MTASKTVAVPVERLYEAFTDDGEQERWLAGAEMSLRDDRAEVGALRLGGQVDRVVAWFEGKADGKSLISSPTRNSRTPIRPRR